MAESEGPRRMLRLFRYGFQDDEGEQYESFAGTIARALLLMNGPSIEESASSRKDGVVRRVLQESERPQDRLEKLFLATLARAPAEDERNRVGEYVRSADAAAYEDAMWALLNSSEFLTNH